MDYLPMALTLGALTAISPGPLLALVGKETLRGGLRAGLKVSLIPTLANLPLALACSYGYAWVSQVSEASQVREGIVAGTTLFSAFVLLWFAYQETRPHAALGGHRPSIWALLLIGWSNPSMLLFWASIGGQLSFAAYEHHRWSGSLGVVLAFYLPIVALEAVVIFAIHRTARRIKTRQRPGDSRSLHWLRSLHLPWGAIAYVTIAIWLMTSNWSCFWHTALALKAALGPI